MSKICLNCGNEVEDTAHFCNICGTEMNEQTCASNTPPEPEPAPPTEQICPSCGKTVPIDSKFCRYCGAALQKESQKPPEAEQANTQRTAEYHRRQFFSIGECHTDTAQYRRKSCAASRVPRHQLESNRQCAQYDRYDYRCNLSIHQSSGFRCKRYGV